MPSDKYYQLTVTKTFNVEEMKLSEFILLIETNKLKKSIWYIIANNKPKQYSRSKPFINKFMKNKHIITVKVLHETKIPEEVKTVYSSNQLELDIQKPKSVSIVDKEQGRKHIKQIKEMLKL